MSYPRAIQIFFFVVLLAFAVAALAGAPLAWDGSFYLFSALDTQWPFVPHGRTINVALQLPVVAASHLTQNFTILRLIFCVCYVSVPAVGLVASWLICRKRSPSLFVWPALSCCLAMLPGLFSFSAAEAMMSAWLLWPVFLAALIGVRRVHLPLVALLALAAFLTHPIAAVFLGFSAAIAAVASLTSPSPRKQRLTGALVLGLLAVGKMLVPLSEYEKGRLSTELLLESFRTAVFGLPLVALAFDLIAAGCLLKLASDRSTLGKVSKVEYVAVGAIAAAGLCLVPWALSASHWAWALAYRFWTVPITLTFMAAASVEALYFTSHSSDDESLLQSGRLPVLLTISGIFLTVLSVQSIVWARLTDRLRRTVNETPSGCIPRSALSWARRTPLDHWSIAPYAIDIQGRKPNTLVLDRNGCREFATTGKVRLSQWLLRSRHGGWFDLDEIPTTIISRRQIRPPPLVPP